MSAFPFIASAIVPIYRLDSLGQFAPPVIFNRTVLAQIYSGSITWWNDSQIQGTNPTITMPNKTITLVLDTGSSANNAIFVDALCQFYTPICAHVPVSTVPLWPTQSYAAHVNTSEDNVAAIVTMIDNSIAFTILATALESSASIGSMLNKAGYTVQAGSLSVSFAMIELATQSVQNNINLNDASGASAWPINVMSYLLVDLVYTRDTCAIRRATVDFWLFIYQSPVVVKLAQSRQCTVLPDLLMTVFNSADNLVSQVLCDGQQVVTTGFKEQILIGGTDRLSFLTDMLVNLYDVPTDPTTYTYTPLASQVAWDKFQDAELDIAVFYKTELDSATIQSLDSSSEFLIIPAFLSSVAPIFNPQITPNLNLGSASLIVDLSTYLRFLFLNLTDWKDPSILKYNPSLVAKLGNQSAPVTLVSGCGSEPIISQLVQWGVVPLLIHPSPRWHSLCCLTFPERLALRHVFQPLDII